MADDAASTVFNNLLADINTTHGRWRGYFLGISIAYRAAYTSQKGIFTKVKTSITEAKQKEEATRLFALNLLTAGMGGLITTHFTKQATAYAIRSFPDIAAAAKGDEIIKDMVDKATNALSKSKEVLTTVGKEKIDWLAELSGIKASKVNEDAFTPVGLDPEEYSDRLMQGVQERVNVMNSIVTYWRDNTGGISVGLAEVMRSGMKMSAFFRDEPPDVMTDKTKDLLQKRAKLALWLAWVLLRDKKYWEVQDALAPAGAFGAGGLYGKSESLHWEPLRKELITLGVPERAISFPLRWAPKPYLEGAMNMSGFIKWADTREALELLFNGLPQNAEGMQWVRDRWDKAKLKG